MKVLLVNPVRQKMMPVHIPVRLGVLYSIGEMLGEQLSLGDLDAHREDDSPEAIRRDLKLAEWDLIHFSVDFDQYKHFRQIAPIFRKQLPNVAMSASGEVVDNLPRQFMKLNSEVDVVIFGNQERAFTELMARVEHKRWELVPCSAYRDKEEILLTDRLDYGTEDVQGLPFPAYGYIPLDVYWHFSAIFPFSSEAMTCKRRLSFLWERGNVRPGVDRAIENIRYCAFRYRIDFANILDKGFMADRKWLDMFLERYMEEELNEVVPFSCVADPKTVTDSGLIRSLKDAGCKFVELSLKGDNELVKGAVDSLTKVGINAHLTTEIGKPEQTFKDILDLTDFISKSKWGVDVNLFRQMPSDDWKDASYLEKYLEDYADPNPRVHFSKFDFGSLLAIQRLVQAKDVDKLRELGSFHTWS